jgi:hypothetical protein
MYFVVLLITGKGRSSDGTKENARWGEGRVIPGLFVFVPLMLKTYCLFIFKT